MTVYIYGLVCPLSGDVRYIGKAKNLKARLGAHLSRAKGRQTNHHCAHWIRSLLGKGLEPVITVLFELSNDADWQRVEIEAIAAHRAAGHDLTNLTGGGDGFHDVPPETLKRRGESRSRTLRDPEKRAEFVSRLLASKANPECRAKKSQSAKTAWQDPEKKSRFMDGMRTPEARARRSDATRRRYLNPEFAALQKAKLKERFSDPVHREQLRKASEKRWREHRARKLEHTE